MQLFILDKNPTKSAEFLADTHIRKMCLETAQILSAIVIKKNLQLPPEFPKPHNLNHPIIASIDSQSQINYLLQYNSALQDEFLYRFEKKHAYFNLSFGYVKILFQVTENTDFFNKFDKVFKNFQTDEQKIVKAYRLYYFFKKSIIKNWHYTKRNEPFFLKNSPVPILISNENSIRRDTF